MKELKFILNYLSVDTELTRAPDGWDKESINIKRSMDYYGLFHSFSIPLLFVKDGADILRTAYYTSGLKAIVTAKIYKRNVMTNLFELAYTGKIDFSTFIDTKDTVECTLIDSGIYTDLKNKEKTRYTIDFETTETLRYKGLVNNYETFGVINDTYPLSVITPTNNYRAGLPMGENSFQDINVGTLDYFTYAQIVAGASDCMILINRDCELKFHIKTYSRTIDLTYVVNPNSKTVWIREYIMLRRGATTTILDAFAGIYVVPADGATSITYTLTANEITTLNLPFLAGDKIDYVLSITSDSDCTWMPFYDMHPATYMSDIQIYDQMPEFDCKVVTPYNCFSQLCNKIGSYPVKSDFLKALTTAKLTTGQAIREFTGISLTTSLYDFFFSLRDIYNIGMGVELISGVQTVVIEEMDYFFSSTNILHFDSINNTKITTASDLIFNNIKIGYENKSYGDDYGTQEFAGTHEYLTPQDIINNDVDWISIYRADPWGIDKVRIDEVKYLYGRVLADNLIYSTQTREKKRDTAADMDVWILDCKFVETIATIDYYELNRDFTIATSIFSFPEKLFNFRFSPHRNLLRHGSYLRSILKDFETSSITFQASEKNTTFIVKMSDEAGYITENDAILISSLAAKKFLPIYYEFSAPVDNDLALTLSTAAQNGTISFYDNGVLMTGFIFDVAANLAYKKESTFIVLLSAANNLKNLI